MSEEDFYRDIIKKDEEESKGSEDYDWASEIPPPISSEPVSAEPAEESYPPYRQEFYGEGQYRDYQSTPRPPEQDSKYPWFWIGVLIAVGVSAVIMVLFHFVGTAYSPGLAYVELVLLLACTTIPGLFVRKVGKGVLGGLMIFGLQFFIPLIIYYTNGQNPAVFYSPYFLFLNALSILQLGVNQLLGFTIFPIPQEVLDIYSQYGSYISFIWLLDLLIMFAIMITIVVASSWLSANLFTKKVKKFWTWFLLPVQIITIVVNLIIVPWLMLGASSFVQMTGSIAAGGANLAEGVAAFGVGQDLNQTAGFFNTTDFDFEAFLQFVDNMDEWFDLAYENFQGLNSLMYLRIMKGVFGRYNFMVDILNATIYAGFEIANAIQPMAHGVFDNTNISDIEYDGFFYQFRNLMSTYETYSGKLADVNGTKPSETDLAQLETDVNDSITAIDYLLDNYFDEVFEHIVNAQAQLQQIDPEEMRNVGGNEYIEQLLNQVADYVEIGKNFTDEYSVFIPFALDIIDVSPNLFRAMTDILIGNVRLLMGFQFNESRPYFIRASSELGNVSALFTPAREAEMAESEIALGFYYFFEDIVNLLIPVIAEEGYMAGSFGYSIAALDEFVFLNSSSLYECDLNATDFNQVFSYMDDSIADGLLARLNGIAAGNVLDVIDTRVNQSEYGIMSGAASGVVGQLTQFFQPEAFGDVVYYLGFALNDTYGALYSIAQNETKTEIINSLDNAITSINQTVAVTQNYGSSPVAALGAFLSVFQSAIIGIRDAVELAPTTYLPPQVVVEVETLVLQMHQQIHAIIDVGLPP